MASKQLGIIDPENMDELQQRVVDAYLKSTSEKMLRPNTSYTVQVDDPRTYVRDVYEFSVKGFLINRQRKTGKSGNRWEAVHANPIGKGSNGTIYFSAGTLASRSSHFLFKPKQRIVKLSNHFFDEQNKIPEYEYSERAKHLHTKPPAIIETVDDEGSPLLTSYLTMKYFPGKNLHEILESETSDTPSFSVDERIQLSIDILLALKNQVHDAGMVHRDLKPENIMMTDKGKVKIIDYSDCVIIGKNNRTPDPCGTLITMPPEQFSFAPKSSQIYTIKSDSYAIGKTLAEVWHARAKVNALIRHRKATITDKYNFFRYANADTKFDYTFFYEGDLEQNQSAQIKLVLEQLTRTKPADRWSVDQAIESLREIQKNRLVIPPTAAPI